MKRNNIIILLLILTLSCFYIQPVHAQMSKIEILPMKQNPKHLWNMDIAAYFDVSWKGKAIQTATNYDLFINRRDINQQIINLGLEFDLYKNISSHYLLKIGYGYNHLSFGNTPFSTTGVFTHWVNVNALYIISFIETGVEFGRFLGGSVKSNDAKEVTGITPNCYNKIHVKPFIGAAYPFKRLKVEARLGWEIIPMLDSDRIARNNLTETETNNFCFEIGFAYCFFRTMKYSKSKNPIVQF